MPILMMDLPKVPSVRHALGSKDRLLFYTDGVTERHDPQDEMYDLPRLMTSFEQTASRDPADQVLSIVAELDAFGGSHEPDDDQTLLLITME
jgi:serine phosphatase RsbU (regulator of sigma subunit)